MPTQTSAAVQIAFQVIPVLTALGAIAFLFLSALAVIWCLKKIGGRLNAEVRGKIKRNFGSLMITGRGLLGCYLAVVAAEVFGFWVILRIIR